MTRVRSPTILNLSVLLAMAFTPIAQGQDAKAGGGTIGQSAWRMVRDGADMLRLVGLEPVQNELKLSQHQVAELEDAGRGLRAEVGEQFGRLRQIDDQQQRWAKTTEWAEDWAKRVRSQFGEVLSREQVVRLYQIRLQVRGALDGLNNDWVAGRLKLPEETRKKLRDLQEGFEEKTRELYRGLRDLSPEGRRGKMDQLFESLRKSRVEADERALKLLTGDQKEYFEKLKGEKFELDVSGLRADSL